MTATLYRLRTSASAPLMRAFAILFVTFTVISCNKAPEQKKAEMTFAETSCTFLEVFPGEKRRHVFEYTNTGNIPLIILNVESPCGCTVPIWDRSPLPPGGKRSLSVYFDSHMVANGFRKYSVTIYSNAEQVVDLNIEAEVLFVPRD